MVASVMPESHSSSLAIIPILVFILACGVVLAIYLIPTFVAIKRNHIQKTPIILVNILLGWTFVGYVIALVWAFMNPNVVHTLSVKTNENGHTIEDKIASLTRLKNNGDITEAEFEAKKKDMIEKL